MALFLALAICFCSFLYSFPAFCTETAIVLSDEAQLKVADAFMEEGEYYRAITEYKRLLILFPSSAGADYALFKIGMACYRGEEYESAAHSLALLRERPMAGGYAAQGRYFEGLSYWKLKKYEYAKVALRSVAVLCPHSGYAPRALIARALVSFDQDDIAGSVNDLQKLMGSYPAHPGAMRAAEAVKLLGRYHNLPEKSRVLAGLMSAVIPGSGYMYAGHFKDGVTAFFINGLSVAGAMTGVSQDNYAVGAIVGGVGLPFYAGNIHGSANAAKKWNAAAKDEFRGKLYSILGFEATKEDE